jgi:hypothetical protein
LAWRALFTSRSGRGVAHVQLLHSTTFLEVPPITGLVWGRKLVIAAAVARGRAPAVPDKMSQGTANMEDHETRRKLVREWMALPKDKRQTEEQVAAFAKTAAQKNEFHRSRRDPSRKFRRDPHQKLMGWLLPRAGKS